MTPWGTDDRDNVLPDNCIFCPIAAAARTYGTKRLEAFSRKVVFRLQRIDATGIYGDGCKFKTLWDEYCFEVQSGPRDQLEWAWEASIAAFLSEWTENLSPEEGVLLTFAAGWELDIGDLDENRGFDEALIQRGIKSKLDEAAGARPMERFFIW